MRLESGVGLDLSDVAGIHDHVGVLESLLRVAIFAHVRTMNIAGLRNPSRTSASSRGTFLVGRAGKHLRRARLARYIEVDHERHGFVFDLYLGSRVLRGIRAGG